LTKAWQSSIGDTNKKAFFNLLVDSAGRKNLLSTTKNIESSTEIMFVKESKKTDKGWSSFFGLSLA
jgi:hypothetical protein